MKSNPRPSITRDLVANLREDDLYGGEMVLYRYCTSILEENSAGEELVRQELAMLAKVPRKLGYYYLIFRLDGLWGSGGMRSAALEFGPGDDGAIMRRSADAFRHFGDSETAALVDELATVALLVSAKIDELEARNASEKELSSLVKTIDAFDDRFQATRRKLDVYSRIIEDMHRHPEDYIP